MTNHKIVIEDEKSTVVSNYTPQERTEKDYQSEAALEKKFIEDLKVQGYEYLPIHTADDLVQNLKTQLEKLNDYEFFQSEWERFSNEAFFDKSLGIVEKTRLVQEDYIQVLKCDNGKSKNIKLIDKDRVHKNFLQVINQYAVSKDEGAAHDNRYDVTILVNGLPLVHVELKRRGAPIKEAFNQIERYQRESFWAASGLYEFAQIFVISNGTSTKYYSNTTRFNHIKDITAKKNGKSKKSNSFEFTSFWADARNNNILDLVDFTKTFFAKHTILNILTRYCVFTTEKMLLVMRPYQIVATERILNRIKISSNYKKMGTVEAGGYIWHTTGSGKTLTSFKTAQMASKLSFIDKVLFVVDRKDLDYQTMKEYDRFEKGAANSNTSTAILKKQLMDDGAKIIITTIQKLATFIKKNAGNGISKKHIVIIFDECHRSQAGDMHKLVTKFFKNYHLFGFTGTPIFKPDGASEKNPTLYTTDSAFGDRLHTYTIVDAINDKNVLPFRVEYYNTIKEKDEIQDKAVYDIDREKVFFAAERVALVTKYILEHFKQKTKNCFNSIFAVSSIEAAKKYYAEFKKQMNENPAQKLKVALIYSYGVNEEEKEDMSGIIDEENSEDTSALSATDRDFLSGAINDYNETFSANFSTDGDCFQNYYKDVSQRMKNKEIDLLIVVNMFLTGFDATTLNTLWVDKNLKMHGLIQAFSRTNRILNSVKTFGNIVCFRNLQEATNEAISVFGDKKAGSIALLRSFKDYYYGFEDGEGKRQTGYVEMIHELLEKFPLSENIFGEKAQGEFIVLLGAILRMRNLLSSFDDFAGNELLSERDFQDYLAKYQDIHDEWKKHSPQGEKEDITADVIFEMELVKQIEINIDYILLRVEEYQKSNFKDKEIFVTIQKAISASPELRSKKELIENFIANINENSDIVKDWESYVSQEKEKALATIIKEENLKNDETRRFVEVAFRDGFVKTTGTNIDNFMPPISRFGSADRAEKKQAIIEKLMAFFEKFFGV